MTTMWISFLYIQALELGFQGEKYKMDEGAKGHRNKRGEIIIDFSSCRIHKVFSFSRCWLGFDETFESATASEKTGGAVLMNAQFCVIIEVNTEAKTKRLVLFLYLLPYEYLYVPTSLPS